MIDDITVESFRKGNMDSFECVFNYYEKGIYRFIFNMVRNHDIAEDLTQDVFVKVYKNAYKYDPEYPMEPWLFKIAYNVTINFYKKNKNSFKEVQIDEAMHKATLDKNSIDEYEMKDIIIRAIQSFKPDCRAIFILRILEDLSFEQIALMFGVSSSAVRLKFYRNRKVLTENLNKLLKED